MQHASSIQQIDINEGIGLETQSALFLLTRDPMLWVDANGTILQANGAFKRLGNFGETPLEQRLFDDLSVTPWQLLLTAGLDQPCLWQFYDAKRQPTATEAQLIPVTDADGRTLSYWLLIFDLSNKEPASSQLVASEKAFRTLFDNSFDAMAFFDTQARCQIANHAFSDIIGYDQADLDALQLSQLNVPGWEAVDQQMAEQLHIKNATDVFEREYFHKDGHTVSVSMRATAVKDDDTLIGTWFILRDISKNQLQLRTLQHQQHLLELTGRLAGVGGWEYVSKARDVKFTPEACKLLGLAPHENHRLTDMLKRFAEDSSYEIQASVEVAFLLKTPFDIEVEYVGFKQPRYLRLTGRVKKEGTSQYIVGAIQDISRFRTVKPELSVQETQTQFQGYGPSYQDKLTGLPNKSLFSGKLKSLLGQAHKQPLIFIEIDLQNFRRINENAGYSAGDECLKQTARRLQAHLKTDDVLARIGGDEFGIALTHHSEQEATDLADSLIQAIAQPIVFDQQRFQLQAAACIVISAPQSDSSDLLRAANEGVARIKSDADASYVIRLPAERDKP